MASQAKCPATGKVRFHTEHAAQVALVGAIVRRNAGRGQRRECRHYQCPVCHGWHLTSKPKRPEDTP